MWVVVLGFVVGIIGPLLVWPPRLPSLSELEFSRQDLTTVHVNDGQRTNATEESRSIEVGDERVNEIVRTVMDSNTRKSKILCWVPSRVAEGPPITRIVQTWAETCDLLLFTATSSNPKYNVVKIEYPLTESLWNMIHPAWHWLAIHHLENFDWFIKLDDDTYFSGDNFKSLVRDFDPDDRYYLGHTAYEKKMSLFSMNDTRSKFNLGAGHALSRGSLRWLEPFLPNSKKPLPSGYKSRCARTVTWAEDVELRRCMFTAGFGDANNSRDAWGRENFLAFPPLDNFVTVRRPDSHSWFWHGKPLDTGSGASCCGSRPILWHGLKDAQKHCFYYLQYFLYNVTVDPMYIYFDY